MAAMLTRTTLTITATLALLVAASPAMAEEADPNQQALDAWSRALGQYMATQVEGQGLDPQLVLEGFQSVVEGGEERPSDAELQQLQQAFMQAQQALQEKRNEPLEGASQAIIEATDVESPGADWKQAQDLPAGQDDAFYEAFVAAEGVQVTDSGLAYQVIEEGEGPSPSASDTVTVHYVGRHTSGEIFDSSVQRGELASFPLDGVIPGWTEGLQLMKTGGHYRFVIPGALAYGEKQEGSQQPTGVLIFDVFLLRVGS